MCTKGFNSTLAWPFKDDLKLVLKQICVLSLYFRLLLLKGETSTQSQLRCTLLQVSFNVFSIFDCIHPLFNCYQSPCSCRCITCITIAWLWPHRQILYSSFTFTTSVVLLRVLSFRSGPDLIAHSKILLFRSTESSLACIDWFMYWNAYWQVWAFLNYVQ